VYKQDPYSSSYNHPPIYEIDLLLGSRIGANERRAKRKDTEGKKKKRNKGHD
jgi:hypothetical protein